MKLIVIIISDKELISRVAKASAVYVYSMVCQI